MSQQLVEREKARPAGPDGRQVHPESAKTQPAEDPTASSATEASPATAAGALALARERGLCNGISPWLSPLAMVVTQDLAL
ncbi:MAG: hypothetical protein ACKO6F_01930, partial [Cyanobium sp.]